MDFPEMLPMGGPLPPPEDRDPRDYPTGDGEPMAETPLHGDAMLSIFFQLEALAVLRNRQADWYLLRDNFWYFERGDPSKCCAPDIALIAGASDAGTPRDCWLEWIEGGLRPSVVFEMASRSTVQNNLTAKRDLYESLGVKEYFLFDPTGVYLSPPLRGFRLSRGRYRELVPDSQGRLESRELGVRLRSEGRECRMYDRVIGDRILTQSEANVVRADQQAVRADREAAVARDANRRAEREAARADQQAAAARDAGERAERQAAAARDADERAEREAAKAASASAQNELLRQALRAAGIDPDALPGI